MGRISRSNRDDGPAAKSVAHPATNIRRLALHISDSWVLQQLVNHRGACNRRLGRSFIPPAVWISEAFMVQSKRVQERRLQIRNADPVDRGFVSEIVGRSIDEAALEPAAR